MTQGALLLMSFWILLIQHTTSAKTSSWSSDHHDVGHHLRSIYQLPWCPCLRATSAAQCFTTAAESMEVEDSIQVKWLCMPSRIADSLCDMTVVLKLETLLSVCWFSVESVLITWNAPFLTIDCDYDYDYDYYYSDYDRGHVADWLLHCYQPR